jgi:hypothetical protein
MSERTKLRFKMAGLSYLASRPLRFVNGNFQSSAAQTIIGTMTAMKDIATSMAIVRRILSRSTPTLELTSYVPEPLLQEAHTYNCNHAYHTLRDGLWAMSVKIHWLKKRPAHHKECLQ